MPSVVMAMLKILLCVGLGLVAIAWLLWRHRRKVYIKWTVSSVRLKEV